MFDSSKITVLAFVVICSLTFIQGNFFKETVVKTTITTMVFSKYSGDPKKAKCILEDLLGKDIEDKVDIANLTDNLQPFIDAADLSA